MRSASKTLAFLLSASVLGACPELVELPLPAPTADASTTDATSLESRAIANLDLCDTPGDIAFTLAPDGVQEVVVSVVVAGGAVVTAEALDNPGLDTALLLWRLIDGAWSPEPGDSDTGEGYQPRLTFTAPGASSERHRYLVALVATDAEQAQGSGRLRVAASGCRVDDCGGVDCEDGNPCTLHWCDAGVCQTKPAPDGAVCDDCGICLDGACAAGTTSCDSDGATCALPGGTCGQSLCYCGGPCSSSCTCYVAEEACP